MASTPPDRPPAPTAPPMDLAALQHWAHDLRAALAGASDHLRMMAAQRQEPAAEAHGLAAIRQIEAAGRMLARAQAICAGEEPLPLPSETAALLRDLDAVFSRTAALRGARIVFQCDPSLPDRIGLDRVALERILRNLIGNAIRHAEARRIEVSLAAAAPGRLDIAISDDGRGFPAALLAGARVPPLPAAGGGLGFGIVAAQVEALGGRWGWGDRPDGGARVWVELPFTALPGGEGAQPQDRLAQDLAALRGGRMAGRSILAVDDNDTALTLIAVILGAEGALVDAASSGEEAVALMEQKDFDLLIVDATMPGLTGAQVIRALRDRPGAAARAPALAMTADTSARRHDELIAAGANRVVTKPLPDPAELIRIIERLLRNAQGAEAPPMPRPVAPEPAGADEDDDAPLFDPEPLTRVCILAGRETGQEILERLVADLTETLARLDDAGLPPNPEALRSATHVLIALAGTAGAMRLLKRTQALNHALHSGAPVELVPRLNELRLLTRGAIAAITRMPFPGDAPEGPQDQSPA